MKQTRKIIGTVLGLILLLISLIFIMTTFMAEPAKKIAETKVNREKLLVNGSVSQGNLETQGAHENQYFKKNGSFFYEYVPAAFNKVFTPSSHGVQLYCIQKGGTLRTTGNSVDAIRALSGTNNSIGCTASLPAKRYSNTFYVCIDNHSQLGPIGSYIVTAPSNYIATFPGIYRYGKSESTFETGENISEEVRQVAIWLNPATNQGESFEASGAEFSYLSEAQNLSDEAEEYQAYEQTLNANVNEPIKETTEEKVKINVNSKEQYLIIGPYKMDYIAGIGSNATFAGISNIQVKGYNDKEKTKYVKNAEILSYIQNGEENKLQYFTPTEALGYVDYNKQSYPVSGQEFYLKIKNPNQLVEDEEEKINYIEILVDYGYMTASGTKCELEGHQLVATAKETSHTHNNILGASIHVSRYYTWNVTENPLPQQKMMDAWGNREYYTLTIHLNGKGDGLLDITMNLGGYVWEDTLDTKVNKQDGINPGLIEEDTNDKPIENVKVTLYECILDKNGNVQYKNGKIVSHVVDLLSKVNEEKMTEKEIATRINPQLTDEDGYYQFDGLDSSNKYYVTFEYNGQVYMPTEYLVTDKEDDGTLIQQDSVSKMVNAKLYNKDIWRITSKVTEAQSKEQIKDVTSREDYDLQFAEISSSPENYISSNSLESGKLIKEGKNYYNETYSIYELMGFELQEDGTYEDTGVHLIDGFYEIDKNGNIIVTDEIKEGLISKRIKNYIKNNHEYPDEDAILEIYEKIAGNNTTLWRKLQFIEDCKMNAYTGSPLKDGKPDLYPVYDDFTISSKSMTIPGIGKKPAIYDGQYYVNCGLWQRQKADLALRKDIYKAATRINGKTEIYTYDKRGEEEKYWEINLRMQDYANYYGTSYNRELYPDDYNYRSELTNQSGQNLELYVTYKITVRNNSQGILGNITEVVDYYDKDYTYQPDLSWVMYKDKNESSKEEAAKIAVKNDTYYNMMNNLSKATNTIDYAKNADVSYGTKVNSDGTYTGQTIYNDRTKSDLEEELNSLYITGLDGKKLASGEQAYIYLTFKVNSDSKGPVILDDDNSLKENYAEINGYETYYANGTILPNQVEKSHQDVAGIIDYNSNPGNLELKDLEGEKYEKNFENDTDRAKSIKVTLDAEAIRNIEGTAWEDERTNTVSGAVIGDGIRQKDEIGIDGITVELVEKLGSNKEYVWQTTTTKDGGKYQFSNIIPGNYIVRFTYGNNKETVLTKSNGGLNAVSYNGQDFKSTLYQKDIANNKEIGAADDTYYDIKASDACTSNLSDAKDLWESKTVSIGRTQNNSTNYQNETYAGRTNTNNYSTNNVTNHKAEVLASPYANTINQDLINELMQNTHMTAETAIIVLEGEYNRTNTDGNNKASNGNTNYFNGNDYNGNYTLYNVDFGITERPKAQLEIDKKVANVKLTLSNGTVAFDTTKSVTDVVWLPGKAYNLSDKMNKNKYDAYYKESIKNAKYNRYSYRTEIEKLINSRYQGNNGLIQITLDEELMHGTSIEITYNITVKNVGETDYTGKDFYYKGNTSNAQIVTTTANQIIDYVPNNLQYRENDNKGWKVVKASDVTNDDNNKLNERLVNNNLLETISKYNTILTSQDLSTALKPGDKTENKTLVLTQVITSENTSDDMAYENITEIVQTSNTAGRRMAYSIVGNQNPMEDPAEVDSSKAERVVILPPTGSTYLYLGLGAIAIIILIGGIVIIKKKVLKK